MSNEYTDLDVNLNNILKSEEGKPTWPCPNCHAHNYRLKYLGVRSDLFLDLKNTSLLGTNVECCICGSVYRAPIWFGDEE